MFPFLLVRLRTNLLLKVFETISPFPFLLVRLRTLKDKIMEGLKTSLFPFLLVRLRTRKR